ncbi:hypothetical protein FOZ63_001718 [Perkinsus olseni]|uniref:Uncharacterized protein n=1 Tax=Perkinsus olseni TaxID=32597 RepID=A0A7J6SQN2_PEROL|nr:hypothetical protein FOZ63_001718 [Perkinsus olseni]
MMLVSGRRVLLGCSQVRFAASTATRTKAPRKRKTATTPGEHAEVEAVQEAAEPEAAKQTAYQVMSADLRQRVETAFLAEANRLKAEQIPVAKAIEIFYKTGIVHPKRWPVPEIVEELRYRGWSSGFHIKPTYYPQPPDLVNRESAIELAKWLRIIDRKKREIEAQNFANK